MTSIEQEAVAALQQKSSDLEDAQRRQLHGLVGRQSNSAIQLRKTVASAERKDIAAMSFRADYTRSGTCSSSYFSINTPMISISEARG